MTGGTPPLPLLLCGGLAWKEVEDGAVVSDTRRARCEDCSVGEEFHRRAGGCGRWWCRGVSWEGGERDQAMCGKAGEPDAAISGRNTSG